MANSLGFTFDVTNQSGQKPDVDLAKVQQRIYEHARPLAVRMSQAYANNLKLSLARVGAIATGRTINSVKDELVLESPSRGLIIRNVVAARSIIFVQFGRRPGKAPIKLVGTRVSKSGRMSKWFEPVAGLVEWFLTLNIRRTLWMPIALAIGRRGIKPREVQMRSVTASRGAWEDALQRFGIDLSQSIFRK